MQSEVQQQSTNNKDIFDDWMDANVESQNAALEYFRRELKKQVNSLSQQIGTKKGFCVVTGIAVGEFSEIDRFGEITDELINVITLDVTQRIYKSERLPEMSLENGILFLPLIGSGELFGFVILMGDICNEKLSFTRNAWQAATISIANYNFTRRVHTLTTPFFKDIIENDEFNEDSFLKETVTKTALSFGADGAVIRLFDQSSGVLRAAHSVGKITPFLLADRQPGELLSGHVFTCVETAWALAEMCGVWKVRGCSIERNALQPLREEGVKAILCVRLDEPIQIGGASPLGTLSYYFMRSNGFSWRDVTLFLGFAMRAADGISLIRQSRRLAERTHLLEIQAPVFTQAELAHLLVHDLSHKVFAIESAAEDLINKVKKDLSRYRAVLNQQITDLSDDFAQSVKILKTEIIALRDVGRITDDPSGGISNSTFSIDEVVKNVCELMKSAMGKQKIEVRYDFRDDLKLEGARKVLEHVLLNLIINTIDAAKSRPSTRPMQMFFSGHDDHGTIRLRVWDSGPGIDQSKFTSPDEVFRIGKTTKANGTGMGLPVSRNLLTRYFNGSLRLLDPRNAVFEIAIKRKA